VADATAVYAAANTQRNIAIAVAIVLAVGWLLFVIAANAGRSPSESKAEIELAPNRKVPPSDNDLEGPRLERVLGWGVVSLALLALGLPLYQLAEPGRQAGAERGFDNRAVKRGEALFTEGFDCAGCHGPEGVGGSTSYTLTDAETGEISQVTWQAPALNTVLLRFNPDEVRDIIIYGRKNTPMPAWGVEGGGPMNDQQVDDLVAYLMSIRVSPEEARKQSAEQLAAARRAPGNEGKGDGELLFQLHCARCHTMGWSYQGEGHPPGVQGGGAFGPNLRDGVTVRQFPRIEDHIDFLAAVEAIDRGEYEGVEVAVGSDAEEAYGVRGEGSGRMPGFGLMLTEEQIRAIVEYERGL
jgi:mono/diheme cytochrome c family protein